MQGIVQLRLHTAVTSLKCTTCRGLIPRRHLIISCMQSSELQIKSCYPVGVMDKVSSRFFDGLVYSDVPDPVVEAVSDDMH